jgi:hypothetical protein
MQGMPGALFGSRSAICRGRRRHGGEDIYQVYRGSDTKDDEQAYEFVLFFRTSVKHSGVCGFVVSRL